MASLSDRGALALVGISIALTSCAQLLFRAVMQTIDIEMVAATTLMTLHLPDLLPLFVGLALYACSMFTWIFALSRLTVGFAYPLLSLSYVIVYFAAVYLPVLHETPSLTKLAGSITVVLGVFVMASDSIIGKWQDNRLSGE